jgi:hypothetical protein
MKIIILSLIALISITFSQLNAQFKSSLSEKEYSELGKILDFKGNLVTIKDLNGGETEKRIILETKSFTSAELRIIELSKKETVDVIAAMNKIKKDYLSNTFNSSIEISYSNGNGFEIGCNFELIVDKTPVTTKKEKYYVETKEKFYEGKIVSSDQGGTYIWKEVSTTKEQMGKWNSFIRLNNSSSQYPISISLDDFSTFLKFLEETISKM